MKKFKKRFIIYTLLIITLINFSGCTSIPLIDDAAVLEPGEIRLLTSVLWVVSPQEVSYLSEYGFLSMNYEFRVGIGWGFELGINYCNFASLGLDIKRIIIDSGDFALSIDAGGFISPLFSQEDILLLATKRFDGINVTPVFGVSFYHWTYFRPMSMVGSTTNYSFLFQGGVNVEFLRKEFNDYIGITVLAKGEYKGHNYWAILPGVFWRK